MRLNMIIRVRVTHKHIKKNLSPSLTVHSQYSTSTCGCGPEENHSPEDDPPFFLSAGLGFVYTSSLGWNLRFIVANLLKMYFLF